MLWAQFLLKSNYASLSLKMDEIIGVGVLFVNAEEEMQFNHKATKKFKENKKGGLCTALLSLIILTVRHCLLREQVQLALELLLLREHLQMALVQHRFQKVLLQDWLHPYPNAE